EAGNLLAAQLRKGNREGEDPGPETDTALIWTQNSARVPAIEERSPGRCVIHARSKRRGQDCRWRRPRGLTPFLAPGEGKFSF
ncbi:unnamed protein product, partial [Gulo gulo]